MIQGRAEGEEGETVVVEEPRSSVTREVGRTLLIIGLVALLAVVAAVVLAIRQANRLASPLTDLAETAERLGSGDPRPRHKRYGVPELDRVADVLDSSAERIARMLTAEQPARRRRLPPAPYAVDGSFHAPGGDHPHG